MHPLLWTSTGRWGEYVWGGHVVTRPVLQVIDVPGDHFSLLRQDAADMGVLVAALKTALAPHGWTETVHAHRKPYNMTKVRAWT